MPPAWVRRTKNARRKERRRKLVYGKVAATCRIMQMRRSRQVTAVHFITAGDTPSRIVIFFFFFFPDFLTKKTKGDAVKRNLFFWTRRARADTSLDSNAGTRTQMRRRMLSAPSRFDSVMRAYVTCTYTFPLDTFVDFFLRPRAALPSFRAQTTGNTHYKTV